VFRLLFLFPLIFALLLISFYFIFDAGSWRRSLSHLHSPLLSLSFSLTRSSCVFVLAFYFYTQNLVMGHFNFFLSFTLNFGQKATAAAATTMQYDS